MPTLSILILSVIFYLYFQHAFVIFNFFSVEIAAMSLRHSHLFPLNFTSDLKIHSLFAVLHVISLYESRCQ